MLTTSTPVRACHLQPALIPAQLDKLLLLLAGQLRVAAVLIDIGGCAVALVLELGVLGVAATMAAASNRFPNRPHMPAGPGLKERSWLVGA